MKYKNYIRQAFIATPLFLGSAYAANWQKTSISIVICLLLLICSTSLINKYRLLKILAIAAYSVLNLQLVNILYHNGLCTILSANPICFEPNQFIILNSILIIFIAINLQLTIPILVAKTENTFKLINFISAIIIILTLSYNNLGK